MPETNQLQAGDQVSRSILIVDDEAIIRDLCRKALKGYTVLQAGNGEEALEIFAKGGIDVVLTDVMMPRMTGIELLKRLKEMDPTLVVIVMTGFAEKEIILNALKADADDFISKPLNLLQLKTAVDKALDKKALKEEVANLRNLDRLKSNFLSLISHKFRTPITSISLFLQNLSGGVYDPDNPESRRNLGLVHEEACYLERLVADLLAFTRVMDTGGLRLEPVLLGDLVMEALQTSREVPRRPGVETRFDLEPLPELLFDREKIAFAIKQVIDNAYKFSRETGKVAISLTRNGDLCRITVEDGGEGIAREELPKVFEKFYQVDTAKTGQIRGFGLGLYYARQFVRLHGGTISMESEPGRGTRVTITLPAQSPQQP
ncbi:hybrid sensor histidine kinase/response regulator [Geobacter sp. AOG1]|uniref:hybrid sensor histidine kinase/response regulator n=1 Tax=Geobacter sp. AOG1 TaxID=1566346 RepID=UPI001CC33C27|nr:hybrid sensor histidine kinase/response regulator [Geobacter sp. AOG1]GFE57058.1 hybrid sensor histidine kinase/response regulator [Geobacter sp. AOG1]